LHGNDKKSRCSTKFQTEKEAFGSFEIEIWDLFGIWNLVLGILRLFGSG
jgi:hypothetical protein